MKSNDRIGPLLQRIYGNEKAGEAYRRILPLLESFPARKSLREGFFSQEDIVLITYGDSLKKEGQAPLATVHGFARSYLKGTISTIHFLPFFPYSSDDGFSVMDFFAIDPALGTWADVAAIRRDFKLMFDYVVNHFSSQSPWFRYYLEGRPGFDEFGIDVDPLMDLSQVTRPRSLPLLTEYQKANGQIVHLWTTFSADQIDFNFKSLDVLQRMAEVLLFYVKQGADILRMDAIAYLWKEIGTHCIHLPQTHDMVKLFRAILDVVAPHVIILTETNVPHPENISYFGNGRDEAQMVYNFTLPPLLFYSFVKEDAAMLSEWARSLHLESDTNTFFNFTASHDGIGVRPLEGILPPQAVDELVEIVETNGGQVSTKRNPDGSDSPYELNITYVDALRRVGARGDALHCRRFLASQAIQYVLPGVPATYIHSLLGSRNWVQGAQQTGRARTINREKLQVDQVAAELSDAQSFRSQIFFPYRHLIRTRTQQPAFHPNAAFDVLDLNSRVFAIRRSSSDQTIYALTNISAAEVTVRLDEQAQAGQMTDLLNGELLPTRSLRLQPYQFVWLTV